MPSGRRPHPNVKPQLTATNGPSNTSPSRPFRNSQHAAEPSGRNPHHTNEPADNNPDKALASATASTNPANSTNTGTTSPAAAPSPASPRSTTTGTSTPSPPAAAEPSAPSEAPRDLAGRGRRGRVGARAGRSRERDEHHATHKAARPPPLGGQFSHLTTCGPRLHVSASSPPCRKSAPLPPVRLSSPQAP